MRIPDGYTRRVVTVGKARGRAETSAPATAAAVTVRGADSVDFTARSAEVASARLLAMAAPDVRAPLVEAISDQIGRGEYNVSGSDVAPVMIQEHLQLSAAR